MACLGASAFAEDHLALQNVGAGFGMGGVFTSPYGISIDGSAPVLMICDDFSTEISLGQTWNAVETSLAH